MIRSSEETQLHVAVRDDFGRLDCGNASRGSLFMGNHFKFATTYLASAYADSAIAIR